MADEDGFSFSQDLLGGLSQLSGGIQADEVPEMTSSYSSMDYVTPYPLLPAKKAKYTVPKWTKGLLKTAEDNLRLKNQDLMMKRQDDDYKEIKMKLQEAQNTVQVMPSVMSKLIKESTDFVIKRQSLHEDNIKKDIIKELASNQDRMFMDWKKQSQDHLFEILTSLAEIKDMLARKNEDQESAIRKLDECLENVKQMTRQASEKPIPSFYPSLTELGVRDAMVKRVKRRKLLMEEEMVDLFTEE